MPDPLSERPENPAPPPVDPPPGHFLTGMPPDIVGPPGLPQSLFGLSIKQAGANDALLAKLTTDQVGKLIQQTDDADKREHDRFLASNKSESRLMLVAIIAIPVTLLGLAWIFLHHNNAAELREIIALLLGAGIGSAGGYGLGVAKGSKKTGTPS